MLPTASTCDLTLYLPFHLEYEDFKNYMLLGVMGNDGFGNV